ncbi:MAG: transposase [Chloroflexi bacterium]|nr:transposase [Chloroflexota bacterium]
MPDRRSPGRQSVRLPAHDYAGAGGYFITLVTHERQCVFGEIVDHTMHLSQYGEIVQKEWLRSGKMWMGIELDAWVVMPNHVHGVVIFTVGAETDQDTDKPNGQMRRKPETLGSFIAGFKASVTTQINTLRQSPGQPVWQRNYYEHVIRTENELDQIRDYIMGNPAKWDEDSENPVVRETPGTGRTAVRPYELDEGRGG